MFKKISIVCLATLLSCGVAFGGGFSVQTQDQDGSAYTPLNGDQWNDSNSGPGFFNVGGGDAHAGARGWSGATYDTDAVALFKAKAEGDAKAYAPNPVGFAESHDTFGINQNGLFGGAESMAGSAMGVGSHAEGKATGLFYNDVDLTVEGYVERGSNAFAESYSASAGGGEGSTSYYRGSNDGKDCWFTEEGKLAGGAFSAGGTYVQANDFVNFTGYGSEASGITGNISVNGVDNIKGDQFNTRGSEVTGNGTIGHATNANQGTWTQGQGTFQYSGNNAGGGYTTTQGISQVTYTQNGVSASSSSSGVSMAISD